MTNPEDELTAMARAYQDALAVSRPYASWDELKPYMQEIRIDAMRAAVACQREPNEAMTDAAFVAGSNKIIPLVTKAPPVVGEPVMAYDFKNDNDLIAAAWVLIANVGGGDWNDEPKKWQVLANQWKTGMKARNKRNAQINMANLNLVGQIPNDESEHKP